MTESATTPSAGTRSSSAPRWTKLHLVYFALASFDLVAVMLGLGAAEYMRRSFQGSVNQLEVADHIHDHANALTGGALEGLAFSVEAMKVGGVLPEASEVEDVRNRILFAVSGRMADASEIATQGESADQEPVEQLAGADSVEGSAQEEQEKLQPLLLPADVFAAFKPHSAKVVELVEAAELSLAAATTARQAGDVALSNEELRKASIAFQAIIANAGDLNEIADGITDTTIAASANAFRLTGQLQWLIGVMIVTFVLAVCVYAHLMGRVLRNKFAELEAAHADEARQRHDLDRVNNDVAALNRELTVKLGELREAQEEVVKKGKMEQLGQLTATVAHEIRNPLGAVRTSAFLLGRKVKSVVPDAVPLLDRIEKGVTRCDHIITQLLDFSRTSHLKCEAADLDAWLAKIVEEEARQLPSSIIITCDLGLDGAFVPFDPSRLQRAMSNLLLNASEALVEPHDKGSSVTGAAPHIHLSTRIEGGKAQISVKDNGPGMTEDVIARVREPLFTTKSFGTGLGIPAVEQIATQHGGTLQITSLPGQGAQFTLQLPLPGKLSVAA